MVELKGTTKQIAWAETVREEIIDRVERHLEVMVTGENLLERNKQVSYLRDKELQSMKIPVKYYKELLDFCDDFNFAIKESVTILLENKLGLIPE
jgi:hypothetical protein